MTFSKVEAKINRPPAAHNVARLLDPSSETKTTDNIARFSLGIPTFNYVGATKMIKDKVALGLDLATALKAVSESGSPAGRIQNQKLVRAFYAYDKTRKYSDRKVLDSYNGQFRISRKVMVPTSPTFTIFEHGHQVPVVMCGWKDMPLRPDQIRAWLSMLESGLFSFADYRNSPWEVLLFLEETTENGKIRQPRVIRRGEYNLFTEAELRELAAMYARAQKAAMPIARELWEKREEKRKEQEPEQPQNPSVEVDPPMIRYFADTNSSD